MINGIPFPTGPMWYIGFFIGALTILLAHISLWFFPKNLPKQRSIKEKVNLHVAFDKYYQFSNVRLILYFHSRIIVKTVN